MKTAYGYLYIAIGEMFRHEAVRSCRSLKRFTSHAVCLVTDDANYSNAVFDQVIFADDVGRSFGVKISGMMLSPFEKTVYLDTDTFVCAPIDEIFEFLDYFDMGTTLDLAGHSVSFWRQYQPAFNLKMRGVLHEFNTGVVGFRNTTVVNEFFATWRATHDELNMYADMPTFREAFLRYPIKIGILPQEYNFTGIKSMAIAHGKVRVIHDRLGEKWNDLRSHMASFEVMDRIAKRINKIESKRLIVPYVGVIPYSFSPFYLKQRLKRLFGVRQKKKRESFVMKDQD